jgi:hypothetical protein
MRYVRDEILSQGLDLASSPTVDAHDRPGGVIQSNAYCIRWLQNALDMFHSRYPFSMDVTSVNMAMIPNEPALRLATDYGLYLPTDFVLDVRNGLLVNLGSRLARVRQYSFQRWLDISNTYSGNPQTYPLAYTLIKNQIKIAPLVTSTITASLWYYAQPAILEADSVVPFPDEWTLIEFIRLKAREWTNSIDVGIAQQYMQKELGRLRSAGLLHNSEYDSIPLENNQVFTDSMIGNSYSWMGNYAT